MGVDKFKRDILIPAPIIAGGVRLSRKPLTGARWGTELAIITTPVTSAQLTSSFTTPVSIVPPVLNAQLVTQVALVDAILFQFKYPSSGGVQYTGGGAVSFVYHGTSIRVHGGAGIGASVIQAAANYLVLLPPISANLVATAAEGAGLGIDLATGSANFAAGNGTAIVTAFYSILTLQ